MRRIAFCFFAALTALLSPWTHAAEPALPPANLLVEMRWVAQSASTAALAAARQGAVVVGTAGSYSPRGAQTLSTQDHDEAPVQQQMLVLNGQQASVQLSETVPLQWLDIGVQNTQQSSQQQGTQQNLQAGAPPTTSQSSSTGSSSSQMRTQANLRQGFVEQTRGFVLSPRWPGGRHPVTLTFKLASVAPSGAQSGLPPPRSEISSTVQLPLDQWFTVARQGGAARRSQPGVLSTRDAEGASGRELQMRVSVAP